LPPAAPQELVPPSLPIISVSKGIEVSTGQLMSEVVPSVLGKKQRTVYISGEIKRHCLLQDCGANTGAITLCSWMC
jgi:hypothetical protein